MPRLCSKFRSMAVVHAQAQFQTRRCLHHSPLSFPICKSNPTTKSLLHPPALTNMDSPFVAESPMLPSSFTIVRHLKPKDRKRRKMLTPTVSKLKKYKLKFYSSCKGRFTPLNDGTIRRWKEGKRHNAHLKPSSNSVQENIKIQSRIIFVENIRHSEVKQFVQKTISGGP